MESLKSQDNDIPSTDIGLDLLANDNKINVASEHDDIDDLLNSDTQSVQSIKTVSSKRSISTISSKSSAKYSHRESNEVKIRKIELLRLFGEYEKQGYQLSDRYTLKSKIEDMEIEYNVLKSTKTKKNALKLSQGFLINAVQALEFLNTNYDPIGMDLIGFSEVISLGIHDYDDVLEELYEKYKHYSRKVEPELKLVLMLGASATTFHTSKRLLNKVPGMEDQIKKNPSFVNKIGKQMVSGMDKKQEEEKEIFNPKFNTKKNREVMSRLNKQRKTEDNITLQI